MKVFICALLALALSPLRSQDVTDVAAMAVVATSSTSTLLSVTGSDGTACTLTKVPGSYAYAVWKCASANAKMNTTSTRLTAFSDTATSFAVLSQGQVTCLIGLNPTTAAATMGSLGSVPLNGIAWSCFGASGIVKGTAVWP